MRRQARARGAGRLGGARWVLTSVLTVTVLLLAACNGPDGGGSARKPDDPTIAGRADSATAQLDLPPVYSTAQEIVTEGEPGRLAGQGYTEVALREALATMPEGLTSQEAFAYLLSLLAEDYRPYASVFAELSQPDFSQPLVSIGADGTAVSGTNTSVLNVEVILDSSGSMAQKVPGGTKMALAKQAVSDFLGGMPEGAQVGLRVFGHKGSSADADKELSCASSELIYPLQPFQKDAFAGKLATFQPSGWTPIAASLAAAADDLAAVSGSSSHNMIYLVTDGIETCDGDPVAAAQQVHESDVQAVVNIIGFDVDDEAQRQLQKAAQAGGGSYVTVRTADELRQTLHDEALRLLRENQAWLRTASQGVASQLAGAAQQLSEATTGFFDAMTEEQQRLDEANRLLREEGKYADTDTYLAVGHAIDERRSLLSSYLEDQRSALVKAQIDEASASHGEVGQQSQENIDSIMQPREQGGKGP